MCMGVLGSACGCLSVKCSRSVCTLIGGQEWKTDWPKYVAIV